MAVQIEQSAERTPCRDRQKAEPEPNRCVALAEHVERVGDRLDGERGNGQDQARAHQQEIRAKQRVGV